MLWLTGLLGVMVIGTVSMVDLSGDESSEAELEQDDMRDQHSNDFPSLLFQMPQDSQEDSNSLESVTLGDWITKDTDPERMDFDTRADDLVLIWDDSIVETPDISILPNEATPDLTDVYMGDLHVAQVPSDAGLTKGHISLIPLSAAETIGWARAAG